MTDDLVKELRWYNSNSDASKKMHRAADRIEKLEAALREIAALGYWDGDRAMNIASKALETQTYGGQQDDSALKADRPAALSAEDIRKMNHE
jgi:hypothetical protein